MGMLEHATASQLMLMGHEALDCVQASSIDTDRLRRVFAGCRYNEREMELAAPPLHELFPADDSEEFVELLRNAGFRVNCHLDVTYICWKFRPSEPFPTANVSMGRSIDARVELVDSCISDIREEIGIACDKNEFQIRTRVLDSCTPAIVEQVITFLKLQGYTVSKAYGRGFERIREGYFISWGPKRSWWRRK